MAQVLTEPPVNGKELRVLRTKIRPFADQPRRYFDTQQLQELADSIAEVGQVTPVLVRKLEDDPNCDYELIDGQRRWFACRMAGVETLRAFVMEVRDADHQFLLSSVANFGRADHTPLEAAYAIKYFRDRDIPVERIAKMFARSTVWVYQHLRLLKLHPDAQALMSPNLPEERRLSLSTAILLTDLSSDVHVEIATTIIGSGMKLKQARHYMHRRAEVMGVKIGNLARTPHQDYKLLQSFVGRFRREMEMFLGMPSTFFKDMFHHRVLGDHAAIIAKLEECCEQFQLLLKVVKENGKKE